MSKITHNLQVTFPRTLAKQLKIKPGDKIDLVMAGDTVKLRPADSKHRTKSQNLARQLRLFDQASRRQKRREKSLDPAVIESATAGRGWKREQLYNRGGTDRH